MAAPDPDAPCVIDGDGLFLIPDHKGVVRRYLPELAPEGLDDWAMTLRRMDKDEENRGEGEHPYRVARTMKGRWRCTCDDSAFGRPKREGRLCKHRHAAQKIWLVLQRLTPKKEATHAAMQPTPESQPGATDVAVGAA